MTRAETSYADITFRDRNPIKRWLQRERLAFAVGLLDARSGLQSICDFGAGNGELCKLLGPHFPSARLVCYEPAPVLLAEARTNLCNAPNIEFWSQLDPARGATFDAVVCLEVFEHLPQRETLDALAAIQALLKPGGVLVLGVPNEIGIQAFLKGMFRMARRYGAYDARPGNIVRSTLGTPPRDRPIAEIAPGVRFHYEHMGFDWRTLKGGLQERFQLERVTGSPLPWLGCHVMPEIYFVAVKR